MIDKLKQDALGRYDLYDVPSKINEIIDVLNSITNPAVMPNATIDIESICNQIIPDSCPRCGETTYLVSALESELAYYGVGDDKNAITKRLHCLTCGHSWNRITK